jgi:N-acetylglutamate synthase-like GNAT family acetyltransferase
MNARVRIALPEELDAVSELYDETQYAGGILPSDQVVVALSDGCLVGACRLAREHDVLVLRGMRVRAPLRRRGIGARLLDALKDVEETCYCVPLTSLEGFYGAAGFVRVEAGETPSFLRERASQYRARGFNVLVMRRDPSAPGASMAQTRPVRPQSE